MSREPVTIQSAEFILSWCATCHFSECASEMRPVVSLIMQDYTPNKCPLCLKALELHLEFKPKYLKQIIPTTRMFSQFNINCCRESLQARQSWSPTLPCVGRASVFPPWFTSDMTILYGNSHSIAVVFALYVPGSHLPAISSCFSR
jgi:hypothetical protein